ARRNRDPSVHTRIRLRSRSRWSFRGILLAAAGTRVASRHLPQPAACWAASTAELRSRLRRRTMATTTRRAHNPRPRHNEGIVARTIENQTARLPSDLFLWAAGACMITSLAL